MAVIQNSPLSLNGRLWDMWSDSWRSNHKIEIRLIP
jgi:hypothetical protein